MKKIAKKFQSIFISLFDIILPRQDVDKGNILNKLNITKNYKPFGSICLFPYKEKVIKDSIWSIKFKNNFALASFFGSIMSDVLIEELSELNSFYNFSDPIIISIPSSKKSKRKRGYDHNNLLLKDLVKNHKILQLENVLVKVRNTERQSNFKRKKERLNNPRGSFAIVNEEKIIDRNIILFDDVITTGATMGEAKKVLRSAGVKRILTLTIAH